MASILIPIISQLAAHGLNLLSSAVMSKGTQLVQEKLGVNLQEELNTPEGILKLRELETAHEEELVKLALQDKQLDLESYQVAAADTANARAMEISLATSTEAGWLNQNLVAILALIIVLGGGTMLATTQDTDVKFAVTSVMTLVVGFFFGSSRSSANKDATINNLSR